MDKGAQRKGRKIQVAAETCSLLVMLENSLMLWIAARKDRMVLVVISSAFFAFPRKAGDNDLPPSNCQIPYNRESDYLSCSHQLVNFVWDLIFGDSCQRKIVLDSQKGKGDCVHDYCDKGESLDLTTLQTKRGTVFNSWLREWKTTGRFYGRSWSI